MNFQNLMAFRTLPTGSECDPRFNAQNQLGGPSAAEAGAAVGAAAAEAISKFEVRARFNFQNQLAHRQAPDVFETA